MSGNPSEMTALELLVTIAKGKEAQAELDRRDQEAYIAANDQRIAQIKLGGEYFLTHIHRTGMWVIAEAVVEEHGHQFISCRVKGWTGPKLQGKVPYNTGDTITVNPANLYTSPEEVK